MEILDAVAPEGTEGKAVITIAVSNSGSIGGYFGTIASNLDSIAASTSRNLGRRPQPR
jgi:hypothetical protein